LDLGIHQIYPQSRTICYVERDIYSSSVIRSHILKGTLPMASIYSDVTTFSQHCHLFHDKVDYITAGFPCQPFSIAGQGKSTKDHRWVWSSIIDIIRSTSPSFLFLENVANLLNEHEAFSEILSTLASLGFHVEWFTLQASEVGANHQRNRLFIFAYRSEHLYLLPNPNNGQHNANNTNNQRCNKPNLPTLAAGKILPHRGYNDWTFTYPSCTRPFQTPNRWPSSKISPRPQNLTSNQHANSTQWWNLTTPPFSPVCGVDDGISHGMDRLRALGNAVVPFQANVAFTYLINQARNHNSTSHPSFNLHSAAQGRFDEE